PGSSSALLFGFCKYRFGLLPIPDGFSLTPPTSSPNSSIEQMVALTLTLELRSAACRDGPRAYVYQVEGWFYGSVFSATPIRAMTRSRWTVKRFPPVH
ncbi:MAG: hypothetical protein WBY44_01510, partial [Bryobacteraceae bacterium]